MKRKSLLWAGICIIGAVAIFAFVSCEGLFGTCDTSEETSFMDRQKPAISGRIA